MKATLGIDAVKYKDSGGKQIVPVVQDPSTLNNAHMLIVGGSGAGKTTFLKRVLGDFIDNCEQYERPGELTTFHIYDTHEDIAIRDSSEFRISQATPYGINALKVSPDPHAGGVLNCIENFISVVEKVTGKLGNRQAPVLRNMLLDVYRQHGFDPERPDTWYVDESTARLVSDGSDDRLFLEVPYDEREDAKKFGACFERNGINKWWIPVNQYHGGITRWPPATVGRTYPTLADVLRYANRLVMASIIGADQEAVTKFEIFQRTVKKMRKASMDAFRDGRDRPDGKPDGDSALERAKADAFHSYEAYLAKVSSGMEIDFLFKYGNKETLASVLDRLTSLEASAIFKNEEPPFDPSKRVRRYMLKALRPDAQRMFVLFSLMNLFQQAVERGESDRIRDVAVVDETHKFVDESGDDILSRIAREARKFGLVIIASNQDADLPKAFIGSIATKVIVGLDRIYYPHAIAKMGIEAEKLKIIKPHKVCAIQQTGNSETSGYWRPVIIQAPRAMSSDGQAQLLRRA